MSQSMQVKQTRYACDCWWRKEDRMNDVLLCFDWPVRTYIDQLCVDTGYSLEDRPEAMNDGDRWKETESECVLSVWLGDVNSYYYCYYYYYLLIRVFHISVSW